MLVRLLPVRFAANMVFTAEYPSIRVTKHNSSPAEEDKRHNGSLNLALGY